MNQARPHGDISRRQDPSEETPQPSSGRRKARAQSYLYPIYVALSMDSGCAFDHALEVLGAWGGRIYTDMQQGPE